MAATGGTRDGRETRDIVVGVDGSAAAAAAVRYGAIEADRREVGLRLVHVVPTVAVAGLQHRVDALDAFDVPRLRARRDQMLGGSAAVARTILPADRVCTEMVSGERVLNLLAQADDAQTVVLGAPWHPRIDRLITGSVVAGVAAKAPVPVVGVPEGWATAHEHRRIVVGVKHPDDIGARTLVASAIEIAAVRKSRLTVLSAWEFPVVYDEMIATTYEENAWSDVRRGSLEALVALSRGAHRDVAVDFQVRHGQGAHALVEASATADLLVITRRRHSFPFGRLGAAGRAVIRESRCPVEVLPPFVEPDEGVPAR